MGLPDGAGADIYRRLWGCGGASWPKSRDARFFRIRPLGSGPCRNETSDQLEGNLTAIARGDFSALDRYENIKNGQFQKLFAFVRYTANDIYGEAICTRHDELFGICLSGMTS